MIRYKVTVS